MFLFSVNFFVSDREYWNKIIIFTTTSGRDRCLKLCWILVQKFAFVQSRWVKHLHLSSTIVHLSKCCYQHPKLMHRNQNSVEAALLYCSSGKNGLTVFSVFLEVLSAPCLAESTASLPLAWAEEPRSSTLLLTSSPLFSALFKVFLASSEVSWAAPFAFCCQQIQNLILKNWSRIYSSKRALITSNKLYFLQTSGTTELSPKWSTTPTEKSKNVTLEKQPVAQTWASCFKLLARRVSELNTTTNSCHFMWNYVNSGCCEMLRSAPLLCRYLWSIRVNSCGQV